MTAGATHRAVPPVPGGANQSQKKVRFMSGGNHGLAGQRCVVCAPCTPHPQTHEHHHEHHQRSLPRCCRAAGAVDYGTPACSRSSCRCLHTTGSEHGTCELYPDTHHRPGRSDPPCSTRLNPEYVMKHSLTHTSFDTSVGGQTAAVMTELSALGAVVRGVSNSCWLAATALPQLSEARRLLSSRWSQRQVARPFWHSIADRNSVVSSPPRKPKDRGFSPA